MKQSLKQYIADLTETTAVKERMESELQIAHDIQMGILPKIFPPFPDIPEFDLYATLEPAREVGGGTGSGGGSLRLLFLRRRPSLF
jgi:sigma-B regulation protein RsbU (phosphoserine phosphatase)